MVVADGQRQTGRCSARLRLSHRKLIRPFLSLSAGRHAERARKQLPRTCNDRAFHHTHSDLRHAFMSCDAMWCFLALERKLVPGGQLVASIPNTATLQ